MKDQVSIDRLKLVHPELQKRVTAFFAKLETQGLLPRITQGLRTIDEQNALYAQGRTKKGEIVTNAKGGQSYHNYGYAVDIAFIKSDGSIDFNVSPTIGMLGESCGLEWGGNWSAFKDMPHFQLPGLPSNPQSLTAPQLTTLVSQLTRMPTAPTPPPASPLATPPSIAHAAAVAEAIQLGITNGDRPHDPATREEVIHMIDNLYHILKK